MKLTRRAMCSRPVVFIFAAIVQALVASPGAAAQRSQKILAHDLFVDRLDNGLTVVTVPWNSPGIISYFTLVRAGSRNEVEPGKSGYAHLFEHLMFRGTDSVPASEYEKRVQAMGADNNAFTTEDFTLYTPTIPKESLAELVALEADRFQHLHVPQAAYKDETGAVLGEYNMTSADPEWLMDEALRALAFKAHTYGHTVIGFKKDVEAMPQAYAYARMFFERYYTPDNCVIFAVGDVTRAKVLELVRANYSNWHGARANPDVKSEPEQTAPRTKVLAWKNPTAPQVMVGYKIPGNRAGLRDCAALALVGALVFGESSELYERLVLKEQKLIGLWFDSNWVGRLDPALFEISAKLKPSTPFDEVLAAFDEALRNVANGQATQKRLEEVRNHVKNSLILSLKTPGEVARHLAFWMTVTGDPYGFENFAKELDTASADDVARVARTYLVPARRNVVELSPPPEKPQGGDTKEKSR